MDRTAMGGRAGAVIQKAIRDAVRHVMRELQGRLQALIQRRRSTIRRRTIGNPLHPALIAALWTTSLTLLCLIVPALLVHSSDAETDYGQRRIAVQEENQVERTDLSVQHEYELIVPVYITQHKRVDHVPLETYVRGVVAAEMPAEFELEALKAQALAARTYIMRRYMLQDFSDIAVEGVWVTDTERHQVYLSEEDMAAKFGGGKQAAERLLRLNAAVEQTRGQIIVYEGEPILAAFFSTSSGYTENSEDYWSTALPYLRSVESPWEEGLSPRFQTNVTFTKAEVLKRLGIGRSAIDRASLSMRVTKRSEGGRIMAAQVGGRTFTGRELREKLELGSTQFTWRASGDRIDITVYGSGHGVGMSQWGAQGMALEGMHAEDIIAHYYKGAVIEPMTVL